MAKIFQWLSWIMGLIASIFVVVAYSTPLFVSYGNSYNYLSAMGSVTGLLVLLVAICGICIAIFFRRREARLTGHAMSLVAGVFILCSIGQLELFESNSGTSLYEYEYSFVIAAGVLVLVFSGIGLLYEWLDYRSELK